jgi:hypothetical protein
MAISWRDRCNAMRPELFDAVGRRLIEQRVEHVAGSIRIRKELAVVLLVQGDTGRFEEPYCRVHGQRPQHAPDDGWRTAPEVAFRDDAIRDIAPAAAADENLRARLPRAIEQSNAQRRIPHSREDCGSETGCTGADDQDVTVCISHAGIHDIVIQPRSAVRGPERAQSFCRAGNPRAAGRGLRTAD